MSRVLLEASIARTPVITHDFGLLGHLVRKHELGMAIDCADPDALTSALETLSSDDNRVDTYAAAMVRFSGRFSEAAFESALRLVVPDDSHPDIAIASGPTQSGP
jgi:glycosyltransferase involved in cell wall biosynthesis